MQLYIQILSRHSVAKSCGEDWWGVSGRIYSEKLRARYRRTALALTHTRGGFACDWEKSGKIDAGNAARART